MNREDVAAALANATAAGHPDAKRLAAMLANMDAPGSWKTGLEHGLDQLTGGFSDRIVGAMGAIGGKDYTQERDRWRQELAAGKEAHPDASTIGSVAGGVGAFALPAVRGLGTVAKGAPFATRALGAAKLGSVAGAVYGAGNAPEIQDMPGYAAIGAGTGALAGPAVEGLATVGKGLIDAKRMAAALKTRFLGKAAGALGLDEAEGLAGRAEQAILPSPSIVGDKARALQRRDALGRFAKLNPEGAQEALKRRIGARSVLAGELAGEASGP